MEKEEKNPKKENKFLGLILKIIEKFFDFVFFAIFVCFVSLILTFFLSIPFSAQVENSLKIFKNFLKIPWHLENKGV